MDGGEQKQNREEINGDLPQRQIAVSKKSPDKITGRGAGIVRVETDGGQRRINGGLPQQQMGRELEEIRVRETCSCSGGEKSVFQIQKIRSSETVEPGTSYADQGKEQLGIDQGTYRTKSSFLHSPFLPHIFCTPPFSPFPHARKDLCTKINNISKFQFH